MTMLSRRPLLAATTALALALGVTAPAMASDLTVAYGADPATLDPTQTGVMSGLSIGRMMFDALTAREFRDGAFVEVPALAESWEFVEPTVFEMRLREGVTFHDGTPFTAESVAYTINTVNNPEYRTIMRAYSSNIASVEIVSDHVVRLHLHRPSLILPAQLSWLMMLPLSHADNPDFASHPIGTGPYRFVSYTPGNAGVVERNPDYWGEAPASDRINFRIMPESSTRLAALESGEVDIVEGVPADKISTYEGDANINVVTGLTTRVMSLILNYRNPIMNERSFREALSNAIDREAIVEALLNSQTQVANSISNPSSMGYLADLEGYPYNPESVSALLAEAGYNGEQIDFGCSGGRYAMDRQVCEAIAAMLQEGGVNVNLEIVDWPTFITKLYDSSWDITFTGAPDQLSYPSVSWRFMFYPPTSPTGFADARLTEIIDAMEATTDPEIARQLSEEGQRRFREEFSAALPLYMEPVITGVRSNVEGFALRPDDLMVFSGVSAN